MIGFEEACVAAPLGVALLAGLEARVRRDVSWSAVPSDTTPAIVDRTVRAVRAMSFGELCALALDSGGRIAGPWMPDAAESLAACYRCADARRPVAAAIAEQFDAELHAPMDPSGQQWWASDGRPDRLHMPTPLFRHYSDVYGNGEFTIAGLWTVNDPPPEAHDELIGWWEFHPAPTSRWRLPVLDSARVFEIHRPADWVRLVAAHPWRATSPHAGWELPGQPWSSESRLASGLLELPMQRAAVAEMDGHVLPDWGSVAMSYDGVHLSWAGFITTEGHVSPMGDGVVTMLRYWASERTHWLRACFGRPEPLDAPVLTGSVNDDHGISSRHDHRRQAQDWALLQRLLGT